MKRGVFVIVCAIAALMFISSYVSAISTNMKGDYRPGESAVLELSGSILEPIAFENVMIKRNNVQMALDYDVKKLGERYYIWFESPRDTGNYTLWIKNLKTTINGIPSVIDFSQNFTVSGNFIEYSVSPGFMMTGDNFQMKVKLYGDNDLPIDVNFPYQQQILLKPGDNIINFDVSNQSGSKFSTLRIGFYSLPLYIVKNLSVDVPDVAFSPVSVTRLILVSEKLPVYNMIRVSNLGKNTLTNVYFEYDNSSVILNSSKFSIKANETKEFNLSIIKGIDFNTKVYLRLGNWTSEIPVSVIFEKINVTNKTNASSLYRCSELRGKICTADEVCSVREETSLDGPCCVGECSVPNSGSSGYSWVGYLVVVIVLVGIGYVYMKYRKQNVQKNPIAAAAHSGQMHPGPGPAQRRPGMP